MNHPAVREDFEIFVFNGWVYYGSLILRGWDVCTAELSHDRTQWSYWLRQAVQICSDVNAIALVTAALNSSAALSLWPLLVFFIILILLSLCVLNKTVFLHTRVCIKSKLQP